MIKLLYPSLLLLLFSCSSKKGKSSLSEIEVIKFDSKVIDSLIKVSDTTYTNVIGVAGLNTRQIFINRKDSTEAQLIKHDKGHIAGFNMAKNGEIFLAEDYFPNGQLKTKRPIGFGPLHGFVRHYYEDGRVRSEGSFKNGVRRGIWKDYDENGSLVSEMQFGN